MIWDWFLGLFDKDSGTLSLDVAVGTLTEEVFYKSLAIQSSINLIANSVARCEFLTYEKGKEIRGENYYLFNVEPNKNKNSSKFWRDVIHKLVYNNECLVIQNNGGFYAADKFKVKKDGFKEYVYEDIVIDDYALKRKYRGSEVFHFELHDQKIKTVIDGLYASYSKLIAASRDHYARNNARRGTLKVPTNLSQTDAAKKDLEDLLNNQFKRFYEATGGAVLPLTNGMEYEELASNIGVKGGVEGRDIRAFIDDIFDYTAIGFQIPPQLLKGDVADTSKAVNNLITFCINPIVEVISDEINRTLYRKKAFLERTYLKVDSTRIKAVDIKEIAGSLDILLRTGSYAIDDCLRKLGMEPLNTKWSKAHWMTKNYSPIEEAIKEKGKK